MKVKIQGLIEEFNPEGELVNSHYAEEIVEMPEAEAQKLLAMTEAQQ